MLGLRHASTLSASGRLALFGLALIGCAQAVLTPAFHARNQMPAKLVANDTLKVHMRSGELYALSEWSLADSGRRLTGHGSHYDVLRVRSDAPSVDVSVDSVALFETNSKDKTFTFGLQGIGVMTVLGTYMSLVCLADPKSCFGSCPTFYVEGDDSTRVQAEGFSASVARILEARDVDALIRVGAHGRQLAVHMRNEAWETHMVRSVNILALPKSPKGRVFAAGDSVFYPATELAAPTTCAASAGDCLNAVGALDDIEWTSPADSNDLAAREVIEVTFPSVPARAGLVLGARNSLVTTFLFYQTMAYLGSNVGEVLASMERGTREDAESSFGMARLLGGIEVQLRDPAGAWRTVGSYGEAGPIAGDTKVIPLPGSDATPAGPLQVRLRMAKGTWRIGWLSLAALGEPVAPIRVRPKTVERNGRADAAALAMLTDAARHLVTLPGDDYRLVFELPQPAETLELFLESEGYYYEWMRREWLAEEDAVMAALVTTNPAEGLRRLAPAYKAGEPRMEQLFLGSRFNRRSSDSRQR